MRPTTKTNVDKDNSAADTSKDDIANNAEANDSGDVDSDEEQDPDNVGDTRKVNKMMLVGGERMPHMFRRFKAATRKGAKGPPRIQYSYTYTNDPDT